MKLITIDELIKELSNYTHKEMHVHHTAKPNKSYFDGTNHIVLQEGMRKYHMEVNKWIDIGQHVTLFPDGMFCTGREFGINPASIKGCNIKAFAVEVLGNFNIGCEKLEGIQLASLVKLAKYFDKQGKYIRFHRENCVTDCPGTGINKEWFMGLVRFVVSDIKGHWAEGKIKAVIESGKMSGYPDGTFRPNKDITRAELASMIADGMI